MTNETWPSDWLRGVLGLCVLRAVADGPTYGYAVAVALADAGVGAVKGGTLYPLLSRFEAAGLVSAEWRPGDGGPGRKYYELTGEGRRQLDADAARWAAFAALTSAFVSRGAQGSPERAGPGPISVKPETSEVS